MDSAVASTSTWDAGDYFYIPPINIVIPPLIQDAGRSPISSHKGIYGNFPYLPAPFPRLMPAIDPEDCKEFEPTMIAVEACTKLAASLTYAPPPGQVDACINNYTQLQLAPATGCRISTYRNAYAETINSLLKAYFVYFPSNPDVDRQAAAYRRLKLLATWLRVNPSIINYYADSLVSAFWNGVLSPGKIYQEGTSHLLARDVRESNLDVMLDALFAAMQEDPVSGQIPLQSNAVWVGVMANGLSLLFTQLEDATLAYDFSCRFMQCRRDDANHEALRHLWRLFDALSSGDTLTREIQTPNAMNPRWREVFVGISKNYERFKSGMRTVRGAFSDHEIFDSRFRNYGIAGSNAAQTILYMVDRSRSASARIASLNGLGYPMLEVSNKFTGAMNAAHLAGLLGEFQTKIEQFEREAAEFDNVVDSDDIGYPYNVVSPRAKMNSLIQWAETQVYPVARLRSPLFDVPAAMALPYTDARSYLINEFWQTVAQYHAREYIHQSLRVKVHFTLKVMSRLKSILTDVAHLPDQGIGVSTVILTYPNPRSVMPPRCQWPDGVVRAQASAEHARAVWDAVAASQSSIPVVITREDVYSTAGAAGSLSMVDGAPIVESMMFILLKGLSSIGKGFAQPDLPASMTVPPIRLNETFVTSSGTFLFAHALGPASAMWMIGSPDFDKRNAEVAIWRAPATGCTSLFGTFQLPFGASHPIAEHLDEASEIVLMARVHHARYETPMTSFQPNR